MTFRAGFSFCHFLPILDLETAGKWQSVRRKKLIFGHFEAPELSYQKMTFPEHFWNLQNLGFSVPGVPKTRFLSSGARVRQGRKSDFFKCVGIDPSRSESILRISSILPRAHGCTCAVCVGGAIIILPLHRWGPYLLYQLRIDIVMHTEARKLQSIMHLHLVKQLQRDWSIEK